MVFCHDPERGIVQEMLSGECRGRVVDAAEADAIRSRRESRLNQRLNEITGAKIPGKRLAGVGSGFFVDAGGAILTNDHVTASCGAILVRTTTVGDGEARVVARDPTRDLALLRGALVPTEVATFAGRMPGTGGGAVAAVGHPNQGLPTLDPFITRGTLAGEKALAPGFEVVVVKADIRTGNSGGPLLDAGTGAVLGVVFAKIDTPRVYAKTGDLVRDEGYAIPSEVVLRFLRDNGVDVRLLDPAGTPGRGNLFDRAKASVVRIECWK